MKRIGILLIIIILANFADAATTTSTDYLKLKWDYKLNEANYNIFLADVNGDFKKEIIADSSLSGTIYGINNDGTVLWQYSAAGYIFSTYATDFKDNKGVIAAISWRDIYSINTDGNIKWRFHASDNVKGVYADDLYDDGNYEVLVGVIGGTRGNTIYVIDENGNRVKKGYPVTGVDYPYRFFVKDIDNDGNKEVIVGTVRYSVNTLLEIYEYVFSKESKIYVFDAKNENLKWSFDTAGGVGYLYSDDIDNDSKNEILVGSYGILYVLNSDGTLKWNYSVDGIIRDGFVSNIDNDSSKEIVLGARGVYVLDKNGKLKWKYSMSEEINSISALDLDYDDNTEIIAASNKLYVLDNKGKSKWVSDSYKSMTAKVADINNDHYYEIVTGSTDSKVRVFETSQYVKKQLAERYYGKAQNQYSFREYKNAENYIKDAISFYESLGDQNGLTNANALKTKIQDHMTADAYFNESKNYYLSKDFENSAKKAEMTVEIYKRLNDIKALTEANDLLKKSEAYPNAYKYYNESLNFYDSKDIVNANDYAEKAKEAYTLVEDEDGILKSQELLDKIINHSLANEYYNDAQMYFDSKEYGNATILTQNARNIYLYLGDNASVAEADALLGKIRNAQNWRWILIALGVLIVIVILGSILFVGITIGRMVSKEKNEKRL